MPVKSNKIWTYWQVENGVDFVYLLEMLFVPWFEQFVDRLPYSPLCYMVIKMQVLVIIRLVWRWSCHSLRYKIWHKTLLKKRGNIRHFAIQWNLQNCTLHSKSKRIKYLCTLIGEILPRHIHSKCGNNWQSHCVWNQRHTIVFVLTTLRPWVLILWIWLLLALTSRLRICLPTIHTLISAHLN